MLSSMVFRITCRPPYSWSCPPGGDGHVTHVRKASPPMAHRSGGVCSLWTGTVRSWLPHGPFRAADVLDVPFIALFAHGEQVALPQLPPRLSRIRGRIGGRRRARGNPPHDRGGHLSDGPA